MNLQNILSKLLELSTQKSKEKAHCKHITNNITPNETTDIWKLIEKSNSNETHITEYDAAFIERTEETYVFRCLGCGEKATVTRNVDKHIFWKDDLTKDQQSNFKQQTETGAFFNTTDWWIQNN